MSTTICSALENWVRQTRVDAGQGTAEALTASEKDELARLRGFDSCRFH